MSYHQTSNTENQQCYYDKWSSHLNHNANDLNCNLSNLSNQNQIQNYGINQSQNSVIQCQFENSINSNFNSYPINYSNNNYSSSTNNSCQFSQNHSNFNSNQIYNQNVNQYGPDSNSNNTNSNIYQNFNQKFNNNKSNFNQHLNHQQHLNRSQHNHRFNNSNTRHSQSQFNNNRNQNSNFNINSTNYNQNRSGPTNNIVQNQNSNYSNYPNSYNSYNNSNCNFYNNNSYNQNNHFPRHQTQTQIQNSTTNIDYNNNYKQSDSESVSQLQYQSVVAPCYISSTPQLNLTQLLAEVTEMKRACDQTQPDPQGQGLSQTQSQTVLKKAKLNVNENVIVNSHGSEEDSTNTTSTMSKQTSVASLSVRASDINSSSSTIASSLNSKSMTEVSIISGPAVGSSTASSSSSSSSSSSNAEANIKDSSDASKTINADSTVTTANQNLGINSSSISMKKLAKKVQDLPWFPNVNLDGKAPTYCSRMLGECKRMYLSAESQSEETLSFLEFKQPPLEMDLSRFEFTYKTHGMPEDSQLRRDLEFHSLEGVKLELNIPETFPMAAPFIRVLFPKLKGGFVFRAGAICFEALTPQGWVTTMSLPSLAIAVVAFFNSVKERPVGVEHIGEWPKSMEIKEYNRKDAEREIAHIIKQHKGGSSWFQKREDLKS